MDEFDTRLKTKHNFLDYLYWTLLISVPLIVAGIAIFKSSVIWLVLYIILTICLIMVVYRFYCTHCPHYIQGKKTTKCMFFWGVPKFFKSRQGPLSLFEKAISIIAPTILILFPVYWLILQPALFIIYILSFLVLGATIRRNECCRCVYFYCPLNCVPDEIKNQPADF